MCANVCGHYLYLKRVSRNITNSNLFPKTPSVHFPKSCFLLPPVTSVLTFPLHMSKYTTDQNSGSLKKGYISLQPYYTVSLIKKTDILATLYFVNIFSSISICMSISSPRPVTSRTRRNRRFTRRFNKQSLDLWGTQRGRSISWLLPPKAENILALRKGGCNSSDFFRGHPEA